MVAERRDVQSVGTDIPLKTVGRRLMPITARRQRRQYRATKSERGNAEARASKKT